MGELCSRAKKQCYILPKRCVVDVAPYNNVATNFKKSTVPNEKRTPMGVLFYLYAKYFLTKAISRSESLAP